MSRILTDFGVVAIPSINPTFNRVSVRMLPGTSLAECIDHAMPENWGPSRKSVRVTINGYVILPELWDRVKPKAGAAVLIEAVPGDSKTLRSVLTIVVAIAAVAAGQFYGPGLVAPFLGGSQIAGAIGAASLSTAIPCSDSFLINLLGKPRTTGAAAL